VCPNRNTLGQTIVAVTKHNRNRPLAWQAARGVAQALCAISQVFFARNTRPAARVAMAAPRTRLPLYKRGRGAPPFSQAGGVPVDSQSTPAAAISRGMKSPKEKPTGAKLRLDPTLRWRGTSGPGELSPNRERTGSALAPIRRRRERRRSKKRSRSLQSRALQLAPSSSLVLGDQSAPQRSRSSDSESGRQQKFCS
jgi:hypothetical protein